MKEYMFSSAVSSMASAAMTAEVFVTAGMPMAADEVFMSAIVMDVSADVMPGGVHITLGAVINRRLVSVAISGSPVISRAAIIRRGHAAGEKKQADDDGDD